MGGYSFGQNETESKVKSKSATLPKGRKKSQEEDDDDDNGEQDNQQQNKQKKNTKNKSIQKKSVEKLQDIQLNEENEFLSFIQINEIDESEYHQENHLFQDNIEGDFNHLQYHYSLQEKIKLKEKEYFQKLSLEFYNQQRVPQNEYLELKKMLIKQKEIYEKQPCVNVNNLLSFEKKLNQLDRLWQEIKQDLTNNQIKQQQEEIQFQKKINFKYSGQMSNNKISDDTEFNNDNTLNDQQVQDFHNQDNSQEKENLNLNENFNYSKQDIYHNQQHSTNNQTQIIQKVNYQFIKPGKKVIGVKTEHSPSKLRENPNTIQNNRLNVNGNNNLNREENQQYYVISSSSHSPKSRSNPQKPNQNDQQIQKMYAPFNISKSNQTLNSYQKHQNNDVNTYPRVKSSAIRGYSPAKQNNNNNNNNNSNNTRQVKITEHQLNLGLNSRDKNYRGEQSNTAQTQDSLTNSDTINRNNTFVKNQYLDQGILKQNQSIKVVVSDVNGNNIGNRSCSPNSGRSAGNQNSVQRANCIVSKPQDNINKNKLQNNSSPLKKEVHQFFRITPQQRLQNQQIQKSPQQLQSVNGNKFVRVAPTIQNNKNRPNSILKSNKQENVTNETENRVTMKSIKQ